MKNLFTLILVAQIYINQPDPTKEGKHFIISLTKENFDESVRINPHQKFAVLFMTKKNKMSKQIMPIFNKIAFDEQNKDIKFAQVDCKAEKKLCTLLRIRSYPQIYVIMGGKMYQFQQEAKEVQMKEFITKGWTEKKGKKIPTKMPTFLQDMYHIVEVFIEQGQKTFQSEGKYFWKVLIFILMVYLGYMVFNFLRPVDYSQVHKQGQTPNDKKVKKD